MQGILAPEGNFTVGLTAFTGNIGFLNVWSEVLDTACLRPMASGGMNVNGNLLAWRDVPKFIFGTVNKNERTYIFYPVLFS